MSKFLMLLGILLLSAAWLTAQQYPSSSSPSSSGSSQTSSGQTDASSGQAGSSGSASSSDKQTVEGCLQGSSGNYTLTSDAGATYTLGGDTSKLAEHVGHQVQIKGSTSGGSGASSSGSSSSSMGAGSAAGGGQTLNVESVKHIAKTCKSGGSNK
jgi:hypothetical protein